MPRELRRGSGEILRKTKLRDVRTLSVLNKFIIGMSDCKEKNAKKPHNAKCNTYRKIFQLKNSQTFTP